ncbi:MAG TPA: lasso peptide biosynthesis B2 protein [Sphingomicrobium sp.]
MALQLRDNLHWCDCGGRAVFLDVTEDRYFCLPGAANDAFLRLAGGKTQPGDAERLHSLIARGLLIETSLRDPIRRPPRLTPPTRDFLDEAMAGARLIPILRALGSELRAAWLLRRMPLQRVIVTALNDRPRWQRSRHHLDRSLETIVSASIAASFLMRSHDRCLVRALAVQSACRKSGAKAKLVFGVIGHPFTAHCWVQLGNAVLVGGFEQARLYTPILVIE